MPRKEMARQSKLITSGYCFINMQEEKNIKNVGFYGPVNYYGIHNKTSRFSY